MKDLVEKKDINSSWFKKILILNIIITIVCLVLFLSLSIGLNDYSYIYGALLTLPSSWMLLLFYYLFYKKVEFPHSRSGFNRTKTTLNFILLFTFKAIIVIIPLIIVLIVQIQGISIFNIYSILTCSLIGPLSFFFIRFFIPKESDKGGDENN